VLSAPYVLPDLYTVKEYEWRDSQIVQHGAPRQILATHRVKITRWDLNGRKLPSETYEGYTMVKYSLSTNIVGIRGNNVQLVLKGTPHKLLDFPPLSTKSNTPMLYSLN